MNTKMKSLVIFSTVILLSGAGTVAYAGGLVDTTFDSGNFTNPTDINNPYWSLPTGTTFVYRSVGKDGCEVNPVQVTSNTKEIAGVTTLEVHDQVFEDDDCDGGKSFLSEDTLDWYAQDDDGNVWYFGEDTKSYCDRDHPTMVCSTEGSFQAEVDGAAAGIVMLAKPTPGDFYQQESAEDAQDMAKVLRLNGKVKLTFDNSLDNNDYPNCLVTKEWSPLERGAVEQKFYYPGIGLVLNNEFQGGTVRTELVGIE